MHLEIIIGLPEESGQVKALSINSLFLDYLVTHHNVKYLGIFAAMSLGKNYYGPKHSTGFW
jgi:hypothetical protein